MANFSALKQAIQNNIKQNGNKEITGNLLQTILLSMVTTMGDGAINDLDGEVATSVQFIDGKIVFKNAANTIVYQLDTNTFLNDIETRIDAGAVYAGYATPSTTPAALTGQKVFYVATQAGTYTHFHFNGGNDGITLAKDGVYFIESGLDADDWNATTVIQLDDVPTPSSNNAVKSGGVAEELALGAVYDVSAKNPTAGPNNDGKWESLSALLSDVNLNTLIPTAWRKGGMSIRFVSSSDNKYVQSRYMSSSTAAADFTNVANWQGVDDEPAAGSNNLVKSGGVSMFVADNVKPLSKSLEGLPSVNYSINDTGLFGTSTEYKHTYFAVTPGEKYVVSCPTDKSFARIAFATSTTCSGGGQVPIVSGTSFIVVSPGKSEIITVPEGCSYVLVYVSYPNGPFNVRKVAINVDNVPTDGSKNLVESGGVYNAINPKYIAYAANQNVVKAVSELYLDNHEDELYISAIIWTGTKLTLVIKDSSFNNVVYVNNVNASPGEVFAFKSLSGASVELTGYIVLSDTTVSTSDIHANIEAAAYDLKYSTNILEYLTKPDDMPIEGSYKPVGSGGMYDIIAGINNTLNKKANYEDVGFEDWEDVSPVGEPLSSKYINFNGNLVDPSLPSFKVYSFPVTPGDTVKIHCALSAGASYAYAFYNSNSYSSSTAVRVGPAVTAFVDPTTVIVPDNAAYILIQQFNGSDYGLQKKVINLIKDTIPEMVSDINHLQENTVESPLNVSRFDVGGTLPAGHKASWITINRRMDEEFDSVLNFCNKYYPNLTNKWFDFYSVGKHVRGVDGVSKCDNYTDWSTINGLSTSDALMMAIVVGAVNNIDGDNTTVKWHTGGAHAYGDSATGATPTMRELSNIVRVDGKLIAIGEKNIKGNKCTIDVINNVQGYNTCKEDGTGREIVQQRYHVEVTNDYCEVVTELVALEEVIVYGSNVVTGIGMTGMQYRFIGSDSKRGIYTYSGSGNIPSNGDNKIDTLRVEKDGYIFDVEYDLNYGLGNKLMAETYNCFVTNAAKAYFANIPSDSNIHLNEGDSINWRVRLNIRKA